jgi:hypothetical protein
MRWRALALTSLVVSLGCNGPRALSLPDAAAPADGSSEVGESTTAVDGVLASASAIASDSTGTKLVIVGGGIWTSTNGGTTWIDRAPSGPTHIQKWSSVASDATGTNLVAVVNGFTDLGGLAGPDYPAAYSGDIWTSTDSGATWTDQTTSGPAHGQAWRSVASDASGTKLVAATMATGVGSHLDRSGDVWTSTDAGSTWTNRTAAQDGTYQWWEGVASDATGTNLVTIGPSGVWASTDGGATWTDRTPPDAASLMQGWHSIASDATGTQLVASPLIGDVWTSTDGGVTWTDRGLSGIGFGFASDSTGTRLAAVGDDPNDGSSHIWISPNGGLSWIQQNVQSPPNAGWLAISSSADGNHLVAVTRGALWIK